jgi:uncharacterized protein with GYD domain
MRRRRRPSHDALTRALDDVIGLAARKAYQALGAALRPFYLVMGQYDAVVVSEAAEDETAATLALAIGARGDASPEAMRAFTEDEFRKIVSALP